ncbi:hypothetical protein BU251_09155 [Candidatus Velamenicoccus archaeovorus]|jgi:hypothetical protein|uniref:Uncharacterized protein n=1 Tax=Velamenicoccus archaeovorus TaxID=1930593 RepID=A0A410P735_VELA1|nr:hypothetical protein [Candidatus Velamenicoccus archaeovorus]MDD5500533.1 hypothetical protein [Candidatus Omnitrophota bacterium]QAT17878.1 hypothetical protein BU251_09155 [Candidatus Velamenicoccus archaeovorus]
MAKATVEYKNGKKIVTYPNGEKQEYSKGNLKTAKDMFLKQRQKIDENIALIDDDLAKMVV